LPQQLQAQEQLQLLLQVMHLVHRRSLHEAAWDSPCKENDGGSQRCFDLLHGLHNFSPASTKLLVYSTSTFHLLRGRRSTTNKTASNLCRFVEFKARVTQELKNPLLETCLDAKNLAAQAKSAVEQTVALALGPSRSTAPRRRSTPVQSLQDRQQKKTWQFQCICFAKLLVF
jgi:hypothetical protein